ncbi:hypothetical protein BBBOND_0207830 [Babesia bigemina]|uniref:Secreted protein n=1 Tax=Babesia bigemina TaxID=5866 RepID=A0A061D4Y5_BABBI|nr:hypothetical protein BBBOND_0207830 [Babesia bigemina]CDR95628.1 hypothetical protein BBBOND_0207830 [Babesia bigemina]|eukprot:XP_012767814.1 hypothetical protein BBBOND_0207830 [Babesia bigemina]
MFLCVLVVCGISLHQCPTLTLKAREHSIKRASGTVAYHINGCQSATYSSISDTLPCWRAVAEFRRQGDVAQQSRIWPQVLKECEYCNIGFKYVSKCFEI